MPEHIRAMVVVLVLSSATFLFASRLTPSLMAPATLRMRRKLWLVMTFLAFISPSFWIYALGTSVLLIFFRRQDANICGTFWFLLCLAPPIAAQIPTFGLINYLFQINHPRLLSLVVLLPAVFFLQARRTGPRLGSLWPDRLLVGFLLLNVISEARSTNLTSALREAVYLGTDIFLPYYVFSRGLTQTNQLRDAMAAFVLAAGLLAFVGIFEMFWQWLLYGGIHKSWGLNYAQGYLLREGLLRAAATTGQPIVLGYVMAMALSFYLYLNSLVPSHIYRLLVISSLLGGLIAPLSRGPWVGMAFTVVIFIFTGRRGLRNILLIGLGLFIALPILGLFSFGKKILNLLPFTGNVETENISYRQRLFENSMTLVEQNFWFGSTDYVERLAGMGMVQGQGIVDIVNSYLQVALATGVVGLTIFVGFFISVLWRIRNATMKLTRHGKTLDDDDQRMGRTLVAALAGTMVTIGTVSSVTYIPWVYWSLAGACVAYTQAALIELKHSNTE